MTRNNYHIPEILAKFSDPHTWHTEIKTQGDPVKYRNGFYKAMRRKGLYWRLALEGDIMHVIKI